MKSPAICIGGIALAGVVVLAGCTSNASPGNGSRAKPGAITPEFRVARRQARAIAAKIDAGCELTAQDWADTKAMIASRDWRVRTRGLTFLDAFGRTPYAARAWQLAVEHLADPEPVPRVYAARVVGVLRPQEAPSLLTPLLQDPDQDVRRCIKEMLTELSEAAE